MRIEDLRVAFINDTDDGYEEDTSREKAVLPKKDILRDQSPMEERRATLRRAIAWSEVLGEPACRKRKRKAYGGNQGNFGRGRGGNTETA